jgi:hypothetical protein
VAVVQVRHMGVRMHLRLVAVAVGVAWREGLVVLVVFVVFVFVFVDHWFVFVDVFVV